MSDIKDKTMLIQELFSNKLEDYEWPELRKLVEDKYFYRAIYHLIVNSIYNKKSIPSLSEILNPFKLPNQSNLKIVMIDTVSQKDELAATGIALASTSLSLNKKGISFLWAMNIYRHKGCGKMDKTFRKYQKQGVLLLQLPFSRPINKKSNSKNIKTWNMVPKRLVRYLSDIDKNLVFIFFTDELNYLKSEINKSSKVYNFNYEKRSDNHEIRKKKERKNNKMLKEIDQHIYKHYKTKIEW